MGKEWDRFMKGNRESWNSAKKFLGKMYSGAGDAMRKLDDIADMPREDVIRIVFRLGRYKYNTQVVPAVERFGKSSVDVYNGLRQFRRDLEDGVSNFLLYDVRIPFRKLARKVKRRADLYVKLGRDSNCNEQLSLPEYLVLFALSSKERQRYKDTLEAAARGAM